MRLNKTLNIVIPVDVDEGVTVHVHAMPIGEDVFDRYFIVLSRTYAEIMNENLGALAGARVASLMLRDIAGKRRELDGPGGVEQGLIGEIRRLANVIAPGPGGWSAMPFDQAVMTNVMDARDVKQVENALVFFTLGSHMPWRAQVPDVVGGMASFWSAEITSSTCTEYARSLKTSTPADATGGTAPPSSIPS